MKKKLLVVVAVFFFLSLGVLSFIASRQKTKEENILPTIIPVTTIESVKESPVFKDQQASFEFSAAVPSLPASLPTYFVRFDTNPQEKTVKLVKKWGFSSLSKQVVPYVYDWRATNRLFSLNTKEGSLSYTTEFTDTMTLSPPVLTNRTWLSDLTEAGFSTEVFTITGQTPSIIVGEGLPGAPPQQQTEYIYYLKNTNYPVFFKAFSILQANISTLQNGDITSFSFKLPPVSIEQKDTRAILTPQEIVTQLNAQKGYLSSITSGSVDYGANVTPSFSRVQISSVSIAYLLTEDNTLVPIFVIEGTGQGAFPQKVRYFLRASS